MTGCGIRTCLSKTCRPGTWTRSGADRRPLRASLATSLVTMGRYQRRPPRPFSPGTEIAGVVLETAACVTQVAVGDRVCAVIDWGGHAEEVVTDPATVYKLPYLRCRFISRRSFQRLTPPPSRRWTGGHACNRTRYCWCMARPERSGSPRSNSARRWVRGSSPPRPAPGKAVGRAGAWCGRFGSVSLGRCVGRDQVAGAGGGGCGV